MTSLIAHVRPSAAIRALGAALLVCAGCGRTNLDWDAGGVGGIDATSITDATSSEDTPRDASTGDASTDEGAPRSEAPWYWGGSALTENISLDFVGYDQGCTDYGPLDLLGGTLSFRVGFALLEPPVDGLHHYDLATGRAVVDGSLAGYSVVGAVLLIRAMKMVPVPGSGAGKTTTLATERFAKPGALSPTAVLIQGTLGVDGLGGCDTDEKPCTNIISPTIVIVWQEPVARTRAYQFMRPMMRPVADTNTSFADCPVTMNGSGVGLPAGARGLLAAARGFRAPARRRAGPGAMD